MALKKLPLLQQLTLYSTHAAVLDHAAAACC